MFPAAARHWSITGRLSSSTTSLLHSSCLLHSTHRRLQSAPASAAMTAIHPRAQAVLSFWFSEDFATAPVDWFPENNLSKWFGSGIDDYVKEHFSKDWDALVSGGHDDWQGNAYNALAGVIVMDQFTRNMNRGSPRTWQADPQAAAWARKMLDEKLDVGLPIIMRLFLAMPFMHSEALQDQEECLRLLEALQAQVQALPDPSSAGAASLSSTLSKFHEYGVRHREVVARWGRFPHRNEILGRPSTAEEVQGLADGSIGKF